MSNDPEITKQGDAPDSFDTVGLLLEYLTHWKWFVLSAIICVAASVFYIASVVPTYTVNASIYLSEDETSSTSRAVLDMENPIAELNKSIDETEIEILKSKNNLIKIVDSLQLSYQYARVGILRDDPVYKQSKVVVSMDSTMLRKLPDPIEVTIDTDDNGYDINIEINGNHAKQSISKHFDVLPAKVETQLGDITFANSDYKETVDGTIKVLIESPGQVASHMSKALTIESPKNSKNILMLAYNTPLINEGRDVISALVSFYNQQIIDDKNESAIQTEAFILDRLVMISSELKDVENRLKDYREAHNVANLDAQTALNLNNRSSSEADIAAVDAEREIIADIERQANQSGQYVTLPTVATNSAVSKSIEEYNRSVATYKRALETRGADHPQVKALETSLNSQKALILDNITQAKRDLNTRRKQIVGIDARSSGQLAIQPTIDRGLNEIFREQSVKVNIYTFLLQKREEIAIQKTLATPTAKFIDNPTGMGPVSPRRVIILLLGLLIGLGIPAAIIAIKRVLFPQFSDKADLARVTNVPILSEICLNPEKNGNVFCVKEGSNSPIAELFRLLRNNINFIHQPKDKKVIMVTSSVSGEGKTFVAVNLAMTYALGGKRTLLIGLDIRRPMLAKVTHVSNSKGITTYLSGQQTDIKDLIVQSEQNPNLFILPAGPIPPNPNELLMSDNMAKLMEQLRTMFDYIITDTAPIGLVSDTLLIAPYTDIQLYVTRANYSSRHGLRVLHDAISSNKLPHAYLILNGVDVAGNAYIYRRYGYYSYSAKNTYGYTYGYGEQHKKPGFFKRILGKK